MHAYGYTNSILLTAQWYKFDIVAILCFATNNEDTHAVVEYKRGPCDQPRIKCLKQIPNEACSKYLSFESEFSSENDLGYTWHKDWVIYF